MSTADDKTELALASAEDIVKLKHVRAGHLGNITTLYKTGETLMLDRANYLKLKVHLTSVQKHFTRFRESHEECADAMPDSEERTALVHKFDGQATNYTEYLLRVRDWISDVEKPQQKPDDSESERSVSVASSSTSSMSSSTRAKRANVKKELAALRIRQLQEQHALETKQHELKLEQQVAQQQDEQKQSKLKKQSELLRAKNELDQAELEEKLYIDMANDELFSNAPGSVKQVPDVAGTLGVHDTSRLSTTEPQRDDARGVPAPRVKESIRKDAALADVTTNNSDTMIMFQQLANAMNTANTLPKPELLTFAGDPTDYCEFVNNFEAHIDSAVSNNKVKLNYLIQFCKDDARKLISSCVMLGDEGYAEAKSMLYSHYGKSHIVAHAYVKRMVDGPVIKPNDVDGLLRLARELESVKVTLSRSGYTAEVDNSAVLYKIVSRLPSHVKTRWIEREYKILESGKSVGFADLAQFVKERAQVSSTPYGLYFANEAKQNYDKSRLNKSKSDTKTSGGGSKATTLATSKNDDSAPSKRYAQGAANRDDRSKKGCFCCDGKCDKLSNCSKFKAFSLEDRRKYVQKNRLCFNCLIFNHIAKDCRKDNQCSVAGCNKRHNTLLHQWYKSDRSVNEPVSPVIDGAAQLQSGTVTATESGRKVCLRILPVRVVNGDKFIETYALLDEGADVTLCDDRIVDSLGLSKRPKTFTINSVNKSSVIKGSEVSLLVTSYDGTESISIANAWSVPKLPISVSGIPRSSDIVSWPHLAGIKLPEIDSNEVMLLIGSDVPEAFWVIEQRRGDRKHPYALRSPLGWTILGPISSCTGSSGTVNLLQTRDDVLHKQLERMWKTDFTDSGTTQKTMSQEDRRALSIMNDTVELVDGHYKLALPWREDAVYLQNNRAIATTRLCLLKKKLAKDNDLYEKYTDQVESYISKGYAQRITDDDVNSTRIWYLPHHAVTNSNKPGKVRVVFDCAAKYNGVSLNDKLLHGPDLVNSLVSVLLRFRQERVAIMADIEGMFNQVRVTDEDCDALRFLWWPGGDLSQEPKVYKMLVHIFGATSSPSCASYALKQTAKDAAEHYSKEAVSTVEKNFYVDDLLKSVDTPTRAISLVQELCSMLKEGGFHLTKWISNDKEVLNSISDTEKAPSIVNLDLEDGEQLPTDRALGVQWNVEHDLFTFKVTQKTKPFTRRGILSIVASLYDPLGMVSPVTLKAKLLLQKLCRDGTGWDDMISRNNVEEWCQWLDDLHSLTKLKIQRCFKPAHFLDVTNVELHLFADASEYGYGACAYLRITSETDEVYTCLIIGKSRLAPIKHVTVPRLELSAAVVACQIYNMVISELQLQVNRAVFWTDSMIVLAYIRNTKSRFKTFVANRLAIIHELSQPDQWRHVPSGENPADLASRGVKATDVKKLEFWLRGPVFLLQNEEQWPTRTSTEIEQIEQSALQLEEKKNECSSHVIESQRQISNVKDERNIYVVDCQTPNVIDNFVDKYSCWYKLQKALAWMLRYRAYCIQKYLKKNIDVPVRHLSIHELRNAAKVIIQHVQNEVYPDEIKCLRESRNVLKSSKLSKLAPILDEDILKVGGRLKNSSLPTSTINQVILPQRHTVTVLIMRNIHEVNGHAGPRHMLSYLREKYWVVCGLQACKSVVSRCFDCKRRRQQSMTQQMADLPEERLAPDEPPFSYVGVDFFGPFLVKVARSHCKRYGCIFTCLTTRAVHIEIAHSLNTDSFLGTLTRFISRRGKPIKIFSDNGTNLTSGERELREELKALNESKISNYSLQRDIEWSFNPPHASHMGGVWERMIRSVRDILKALVKQQLLHDEALLTFMAEVERILNDRPITQASCDKDDPEPLTPSKLLLLKNNSSIPYGVFCKNDVYARRWWRQAQYLANVFWRRWIKEYLSALQIREKWQRPHRNANVNDIVLIVDENTPRGQWPLAIVTQINRSRDGYVRSCKVKTATSEYVRPIHKLCLLEASD